MEHIFAKYITKLFSLLYAQLAHVLLNYKKIYFNMQK